LRLLVLVHGYPPAVGGVEFAVRDVCERLVSAHGFEVTVATTDAYTNENFRDGALPRIAIRSDEVANGVRVLRFPVVTRWAAVLRVAQAAAWRAHLPGNARLRTWYQGPISPGLRRAARTLPADAVLAASFPLNHLHYPFGRDDRAPVVLLGAVHPWDPWGYRRRNLLRLTRRAAATIALTEAERKWFLRHRAPRDRVRVIPLGIDPDRRRPARAGEFRLRHGVPRGAFLVAYIGQQGSHKGLDHLVRGLPALLRRVPDTWLAVAGAVTPYTAELHRLVEELPREARGRLVLRDGVDEAEKAALLEDCDVFASPSRHESFGITVLEAWAHSRPVVVGDGPAQRELLDRGRLGRLVPYGDAAALAEAPELRRSLGAAGRARLLDRYTLDAAAQAYRDLLRELAGRSSRP
jgi:glycosyltransferase involved in cell wall biosynthesis